MSKKQETISDIVAEMRRLNPEKFLSTPWYCEPLPNRMRSYADRIEEAAKREREARDEMARSDIDSVCAKYGRLVKKLRSENERLLSALKPVQDEHIPDFSICDTCYDRSECKGHEYDVKCEWYDIVESVRESQRIYKGGAK